MERRDCPADGHLVNRAILVRSARPRDAVEIAVAPLHERRRGTVPVRPVERIENGVRPVERDPEDRAPAVRAALERGAVELAVASLDESRLRSLTFPGDIAVKSVQDRQCSAWRDPEDGPVSEGLGIGRLRGAVA